MSPAAPEITPGLPASSPNPNNPSAGGTLLFAQSEVDATTKVPVLLFFGSAALWLLLGSLLSVLAYFKLVLPGLLPDIAYFTTGRVLPAAENAFVYGWAASAAIGAGLWILARLCRTPLRHGGVLSSAWLLWNTGLTLGLLGILRGDSTGFKLLEFPYYASPVIFTAFVFTSIWAILMFRYRRPGPLYVSHWFILAAFLWFPWIYATANLLLFFAPVQSSMQPVVHSWYLRSLLGVWFTLMALGAAYYIVPKVMGRPVHRYATAMAVFWGVIVLYSWSGAYYLIGGPVPAWMISLSVVSNTLLLVPAFLARNSLQGTLQERTLALRHSPSLRFTIVGVNCFLAATILGVLVGFRAVNAVTHFSMIMNAQEQLQLYAFVSMGLFGAVYYIVPRLLEAEWPVPNLVRGHFWCAVVGVGLMISCLFVAGAVQGLGLSDAKVPFIAITSFLRPLMVGNIAAALVLLAGNICFVASWVLIFVKIALGEYESIRGLSFSAGDPSSSHVSPHEADYASSVS